MSDRAIFRLSISTALLILASSYFRPQDFHFDALESTFFIAVAALAYFGENRFSYMLAALAPPLWWTAGIYTGALPGDFRIVVTFIAGTSNLPLDRPLSLLAWIDGAVLCAFGVRAWRREIQRPGKAFWICLAISIAEAAAVILWPQGL